MSVGPYAVIGPSVRIGAGPAIGPHTVIEGHTTIGRDNLIFQFASLGAMPQDMKYGGEATELVIGDRNTIREFCTFNTGTCRRSRASRASAATTGSWPTCTSAHDVPGRRPRTLANNATLAGHVHVGDWVTLGGV